MYFIPKEMEMKRTIHLAEKDQKENVALTDENDSEVRGAALHMPPYKQQCERIL